MRRTLKGDPFAYIEALKRQKTPFEWRLTNASGEIRLPSGKKIAFGSGFSARALGTFNSAKAELKKQPIPKVPGRPRYVGVQPPEDRSWAAWENVASIDLSAAYHNAAFNLGYFSPGLMEKFEKVKKVDRLKAFGATARTLEVFSWNGQEISNITTDVSPLKPFFVSAAYYVGELLYSAQLALKEDFLFFWVDCAFFINTPENVEKVRQIFQEAAMPHHFEQTDFVIFTQDAKKYTIKRYVDGIEKVYNFTRPEYKERKRALFDRALMNSNAQNPKK